MEQLKFIDIALISLQMLLMILVLVSCGKNVEEKQPVNDVNKVRLEVLQKSVDSLNQAVDKALDQEEEFVTFGNKYKTGDIVCCAEKWQGAVRCAKRSTIDKTVLYYEVFIQGDTPGHGETVTFYETELKLGKCT